MGEVIRTGKGEYWMHLWTPSSGVKPGGGPRFEAIVKDAPRPQAPYTEPIEPAWMDQADQYLDPDFAAQLVDDGPPTPPARRKANLVDD